MNKNSKWIALAAALGVMMFVSTARADAVTELWTQHCASCHGKDGKGETKAGKKANVKDLTDAKYQASLTDEKMFNQIKNGMKKDNKEIMKPFGDKIKDDQIKELVAYVRKFKK